MKKILPFVIAITAYSFTLFAQAVDTIPISIQNKELKLPKNPLPVKAPTVQLESVQLPPQIIDAKIRYWKTATTIGINLNQAAFSNNWKGGGVNSIALGGLVNYKAEYAKKSFSFISEVNLQYGKIKNKDQQQKKTNDRILWDNKAAIHLSRDWSLFGSITFESQFDKGFSYSMGKQGQENSTLISGFMAPGYLTESFGVEYKPVAYFSTRIGTGTARQTFVLDPTLYKTNPANYGVKPGKRIKNDIAFQILSNFEKEVLPNLMVKARYNIFIPYKQIGYTAHRVDLSITAKVNRIINVTITGIGLYDKNQDEKFQASQSMAVGIAFTFPR